jgi:hypothetical protein
MKYEERPVSPLGDDLDLQQATSWCSEFETKKTWLDCLANAMRLGVSFDTAGEDGTCISQIIENNVQRDEMKLRKLRTRKVNLDNVWDRFEMHCFICHSFTSLLTKPSRRSTFKAWSIIKIPSILKFNHKNHLLLSSPEHQAAIATRHLTSHTLLIRN